MMNNQFDEQEQEDLRLKNVVELAKFSFELEEKREQSIINQATQMLQAFSILSIVLLTSATLLAEYTDISKSELVFAVSSALFPLLISMILAVIAQWRFTYETMKNGEQILKRIEIDKYNHTSQVCYDYQWVNQLAEIQSSKKYINDKRVGYVKASMIFFFIAIGMLVLAPAFTMLV